MTTVIKRQKADKQDNHFSSKPKPVEYRPITPQGLNSEHQQEMSYSQIREMRYTERERLAEIRSQKLLALNFGFNSYAVYELYKNDMRSEHDVYRSISMSRFWEVNSLWLNSEDRTNSEDFMSSKLRFKTPLILKAVSFFELRHVVKIELEKLAETVKPVVYTGKTSVDWFNFVIEDMRSEFLKDSLKKETAWKNDFILLPDANSLHDRPRMTACHSITINGIIDLFLGQGLVIKAYALKNQYYLSYFLKNYNEVKCDMFTLRKIRQIDILKPKTIDVFEACHVSRHNQQPVIRPEKIVLTKALKDNYLEWLNFEYIGMKQQRRQEKQPVKTFNHARMFFDELRLSTEKNFNNWLTNVIFQIRQDNQKIKPRLSQNRPVSKFVDVNLWKLAKSDEIFLEKFRYGVND